MSQELPKHLIRVADLGKNRSHPFEFQPDAAQIKLVCDELDLLSLKKARLSGALHPEGKDDWRLEAVIGATASQACVVTAAPVTTRIDAEMTIHFSPNVDVPEGYEIDLSETDLPEELPEVLDLFDTFIEALALALPDYPRAEGAEFGNQTFAPQGAAPLTDEKIKPFAGLAFLKDKLKKDEGDA